MDDTYADIIRSAMNGLGLEPPPRDPIVPQMPDTRVRDLPAEPVPQSAYSGGTELRNATPLQNEIPSGHNPRPIDQYVNTSTGQLTDAGKERMDNPMLGVDTGGLGGAIKAYHGSPHLIDKFDMRKVGTGEGAQAFGHGLYFAEHEGIARGYRDKLSPITPDPMYAEEYAQLSKQHDDLSKRILDLNAEIEQRRLLHGNAADYGELPSEINDAYFKRGQVKADMYGIPGKSAGHMYEVNLKVEPHELLDWDKRISEQSPLIRDRVASLPIIGNPDATGAGIVEELTRRQRDNSRNYIGEGSASRPMMGWNDAEKQAMNTMRNRGIPGVRYLDAGSRSAGKGTHNIVMHNDALIDIMRRYALPGMVAGGAAATQMQGQSEQ